LGACTEIVGAKLRDHVKTFRNFTRCLVRSADKRARQGRLALAASCSRGDFLAWKSCFCQKVPRASVDPPGPSELGVSMAGWSLRGGRRLRWSFQRGNDPALAGGQPPQASACRQRQKGRFFACFVAGRTTNDFRLQLTAQLHLFGRMKVDQPTRRRCDPPLETEPESRSPECPALETSPANKSSLLALAQA
jgi:hypothetical protein